MADLTMGMAEARFADIIWESEPITSTALWKQSEQVLDWKKSTTFTVLKRLCDKGLFRNENGTVTSCLSREAFYAAQSEKFVQDTFNGSLPAFLAAFTANKRLSPADIEQLRRMIADYEEE